MRCAAGGAITTCSPACSAPACKTSSPAACRSCTATPRPGTRSTGWPMTPSATRSPPGRCSGRPGSSSSTSTWSTAPAARPRPSTGGCRSCPPRWSGPAPGCCWRRPSWPPPAAASRSSNRSWTRLTARPPAGPMNRSNQPAGAAASYLINVPALTTLHRSYLAQFHGDAEATAAFAAQALAEIKPGERLLSASAHGFLAVAEWLRGQAHRGRTRLRLQRHRVARGRPAHADRVGLVRAGAAPARPGPPGRGRADLRAGPGRPGHIRPAAARGRSESRGPGRDRLPAGRTRQSPRGTPPRASRCAASSSTPSRWPTAWPRWR